MRVRGLQLEMMLVTQLGTTVNLLLSFNIAIQNIPDIGQSHFKVTGIVYISYMYSIFRKVCF